MSKLKLRPINKQVMVITGASSGIGLATAKLAAQKGASVVLAARSAGTTAAIAEQINQHGGKAVSVECDVSDRSQGARKRNLQKEKKGRSFDHETLQSIVPFAAVS